MASAGLMTQSCLITLRNSLPNGGATIRSFTLQRNLLAAFVVTGLAASCVQASILGPADGFSVYVFGNVGGMNGSYDGNVAVGGNLTAGGSTYFDNLIVNGNATLGGVNVVGTFTHGGTVTGGGNSFGANLTGTPIDFAASQSLLQSTSTTLGAMASTGSFANAAGVLTLVGLNPTLNVFNLTNADFSTFTKVLNVPSTSTVVLNIFGTTVNSNSSWTLPGGMTAASILLNAPQATTFTNSNVMPGSVLAPFATGSGSGLISGSLILNSVGSNPLSFNNSTYVPFVGSGLQSQAAVPEAASAVIWGVIALAASVGYRIRQRYCESCSME